MNETELAAYARKKGLYVEQIQLWRDACIKCKTEVSHRKSRQTE